MQDRRTVLTIIALLVTLGCAGLLLSKVQNELASLGHFVGYEIFWWALVVLLLSYVRWVERRPLASIGFSKPGIWNILIGIAAGIVLLCLGACGSLGLGPSAHRRLRRRHTYLAIYLAAQSMGQHDCALRSRRHRIAFELMGDSASQDAFARR